MENNFVELLMAFNKIQLELIESNGELPETMEQELEAVSKKLLSKVDQIVFIKERSKIEAAYYRQKAREYQKLAQGFETIDEKLTEYVKFNMSQSGLEKIEGNENTLKLSRRGASVEVTDLDKIPDELCAIIRQPNKSAIKEALLSGYKIEGAELKEILVLTQSLKRKEIS